MAEAFHQFLISRAHAGMKGHVFQLDPVGLAARRAPELAESSGGISISTVRSGVIRLVASSESSQQHLDIEPPAEALVGDRGVEIAVAQDRFVRPARPERSRSATCWARSALISSASASGSIALAGSRQIWRIRSPNGVPPGSRVTRTFSPRARRSSFNAAMSVDFPAASMPSNVINTAVDSPSGCQAPGVPIV